MRVFWYERWNINFPHKMRMFLGQLFSRGKLAGDVNTAV